MTPSSQRHLRVLLAAIVLVVAGCTAAPATTPTPVQDPSSSPTTPATETPSPAPSQPPSVPATPIVTPSLAPTPAPTSLGDVRIWTGIRVTADGLAVRAGPGMSYELIAAHRLVKGSGYELETDALRVDSGHYLFVEHGPLVVDGVPWFLVANVQQPDESSDDMLLWDSDGDPHAFDGFADYGWVAGGDAEGAEYVAAEDIPAIPGEPVYGPGPEPYVLLAASTTVLTEELEIHSRVILRWVAIGREGEPCFMEMSAEPSGEVIEAQHVPTLTFGEVIYPAEPAPDGVYDETIRFEVASGCTWSVHALPEQG